jgi:hypothetical protein
MNQKLTTGEADTWGMHFVLPFYLTFELFFSYVLHDTAELFLQYFSYRHRFLFKLTKKTTQGK